MLNFQGHLVSKIEVAKNKWRS